MTVAQKVEHSSGIANSREHVDGVGVLGNHHESHIGNPHAWRCSHVHMLSRLPVESEDGKVIGVLTYPDIVFHLSTRNRPTLAMYTRLRV